MPKKRTYYSCQKNQLCDVDTSDTTAKLLCLFFESANQCPALSSPEEILLMHLNTV